MKQQEESELKKEEDNNNNNYSSLSVIDQRSQLDINQSEMAEEPAVPGQEQPQLHSPPGRWDDIMSCVSALDAALLPCLSTEINTNDLDMDIALKEFNPLELPSIQTQHNIIEQDPLLGFSHEEDLVHNPKQHRVDVEKHATDFMEAANKLQLYFIDLQRQNQHQPTEAELLKKEIAEMEQELKMKNEIIRKHEGLILRWRKELKDELEKHKTELGRVQNTEAFMFGICYHVHFAIATMRTNMKRISREISAFML
ncbi:hypothetical protein ACFE04_005548 [Oxalis oulophora]